MAAARLMYAGAALSALTLLANLLVISEIRAGLRQAYPHETAAGLHRLLVGYVSFLVIVSLISCGLWIWMAVANRAGQPGARVAASVLFAASTVFVGYSIYRARTVVPLLVPIVQWVIGLGAIVLLWGRRASAYFAAGGRR